METNGSTFTISLEEFAAQYPEQHEHVVGKCRVARSDNLLFLGQGDDEVTSVQVFKMPDDVVAKIITDDVCGLAAIHQLGLAGVLPDVDELQGRFRRIMEYMDPDADSEPKDAGDIFSDRSQTLVELITELAIASGMDGSLVVGMKFGHTTEGIAFTVSASPLKSEDEETIEALLLELEEGAEGGTEVLIGEANQTEEGMPNILQSLLGGNRGRLQ